MTLAVESGRITANQEVETDETLAQAFWSIEIIKRSGETADFFSINDARMRPDPKLDTAHLATGSVLGDLSIPCLALVRAGLRTGTAALELDSVGAFRNIWEFHYLLGQAHEARLGPPRPNLG